MLVLGARASSLAEAHALMREAIASGRACEKFREIVIAQGGDPRVIDDPLLLPQAGECELYAAPRHGVVARVEPRAIGYGIIALGGGRNTMNDPVDPSVGFVITARPGDAVQAGEPVATIFAHDRAGVEQGRQALRQAIEIADAAALPLPLISHRVTSAGVELYQPA
jgi:pyrimidine-nucleoside phosphorylase